MAAPMRSACASKFYEFCSISGILRHIRFNKNVSGVMCQGCSFTTSSSLQSRQNSPLYWTHLRQLHDYRPRDGDFGSRSRDFRSRDEEEELEFSIDEEEIDLLRRQHRDHTRSQTLVDHGKKFSDFPLSESMLKRLDQLGYHEPFSIQAQTLPHTLSGRDVIGRALTGSGKTLAFSIPIVETIMKSDKQVPNRNPRAIVISPTRELCLQIHRSVQELNPSVRCLPVYGGESLYKQQQIINSRGVDIVCATPGRLKDHLERGSLRLDHVEFLCLDEADHLLTPDFLVQIENVLRDTPSEKQVMLFSATMPPDIKNITRRYMSDAVYVDLTTEQRAPSSVKHMCMEVPRSYQTETVMELLKEHNPERCILFIKTKAQTKTMASRLRRAGYNASELHSDLSQAKRSNVLSAFRTGRIAVLVATDVAARGLDVPEVDLVIQVEPPANGTDFYIHRSGRTGRAGRQGVAVMIHCGTEEERKVIHEIERLVPLEHALPPNYDKLQYNKMYKALKILQEMPESTLAPALPLVEKVETGEERRLLAAAMTLLKDSEILGSMRREESSGFRDHGSREHGRFRDHGPRHRHYSRDNYRERQDRYRDSHYDRSSGRASTLYDDE